MGVNTGIAGLDKSKLVGDVEFEEVIFKFFLFLEKKIFFVSINQRIINFN